MSETLAPCPDCAASPGTPHRPGCDVARCPVCGYQRALCSAHEGAEMFSYWTGRWPGETECEQFDWWTHLAPGRGWIRCRPDHPGAVPDLNRLYQEAMHARLTWDADHQQFVPALTPPAPAALDHPQEPTS